MCDMIDSNEWHLTKIKWGATNKHEKPISKKKFETNVCDFSLTRFDFYSPGSNKYKKKLVRLIKVKKRWRYFYAPTLTCRSVFRTMNRRRNVPCHRSRFFINYFLQVDVNRSKIKQKIINTKFDNKINRSWPLLPYRLVLW